MAQRVTLDAMIPREDFAVREAEEFVLDLFPSLPLSNLAKESPVSKLLRKPDFQRETNHWAPEQLTSLVASFLDNEVIPSLILWKSPSFIFVIDGGHRLSALRAWMEDDYGDRAISQTFYRSEISADQRRITARTRKLVESKIGRFSTLKDLVGSKGGTDLQQKRAMTLVTRNLPVLWIQGSAALAETSFFKINSQGTALDDTEEMLIRNRRKPIAIGARAILRAGGGHKYWSTFSAEQQALIESLAESFHELMFRPEVEEPLKTLDVALGGTVSPVDALALLIEFLTIAGSREQQPKTISQYDDDSTGDETIAVLRNATNVVSYITGNSPNSLGLHPAVYFYNEKGKYSRFLFLGITLLLTEKIRNNDSGFFKKFTMQRRKIENFLISNKSLIGILLQNMSKSSRVPKMRDLFTYLVSQFQAQEAVTIESTIESLGMRGRIIDVVNVQKTPDFSDDTKSMIFIREALSKALSCPICDGKLDPRKSVSYDHVKRRRDGGAGNPENGALVHPYCNSGIKN